MYTTANLLKIENNRAITSKSDPNFIFELQRGVLLSLKEVGKVTEMQYRSAEKRLKEQKNTTI